MSETSRRAVLAGAAGVGAATVLAACGSPSGGDGATSGGGTGGGGAQATGANPPAPGGGGAPARLAKTADIPVGGGKIFAEEGVVVTQPRAGTFKAFSVACTHQGCPVSEIRDGTINCTCHFSRYSVEDGSVRGGPAPRGLDAKRVTVQGDTIVLA